MTAPRERYVVLGLSRPRAGWFRDLAQWATAGAIPAEFLKCVSAHELRTRLDGGRAYSAVLVDGDLPAVDRDLLAAARDHGCPVIVVADDDRGRDWYELGAVSVLPSTFGRDELLEVLAAHATPVGGAAATRDAATDVVAASDPGTVVAVTGPGGTGASTVAIALAQGLASVAQDGSVLLADLCRHGEQAMLHDARDIVPGVQELVEVHRGRTPRPDSVLDVTYDVPARGYRLLLGLRRARFWSALRPRSFEAALASLQRIFGVLVCDIDADLEGEADSGSIDVQERNLMSRTVVAHADVVVVVGAPGMKGSYSLVRVIGDVLDAGVPDDRVLPVVVPGPRHPRVRAEVAATVAELVRPVGGERLPSPLFLPRRRVDAALRDGVPLPEPLPRLLVDAHRAVLARAGRRAAATATEAGERIVPGSLGLAGSEGSGEVA
ncbi:MAG: hypothetical protein KY469_16285 [Actinobacteria bacterium]|nr:hypothetical protein [Actinomycetota bacterium]